MKSRIHMATDDVQLSGWTEKKLQSTSQSQTCTKNCHGHWWSAVNLIHYSFLNLSKSITSEKYAQQIDKMHRIPAASIGQQKGPNSSPQWCLTTHYTTNASNVEKLGYKVLPHPPYLFWPLANWLPLLQASWQLFSGKMLSQPARGRKCFPRLHQIPKHTFFFFYATGINKAISLCKNLLIAMVPILINIDVFEPSYNLKFMAWNHNYVCTNIISSLLSYKGGARKYYFLNCLT